MRLLKFSGFPLIGLSILFLGLHLFESELRLALSGNKVVGSVSATILKRSQSSDFVRNVDTVLTCTTLSGKTIQLPYRNFKFHGTFPKELERIRTKLASVASGPIAEGRRLLWGEEWLENNSDRIVRVEKQEIVSGFLTLKELPKEVTINNGVLTLPDNGPINRDITRAVLDIREDFHDPDNPDSIIIDYETSRSDGSKVERARDDFYLYREPYFTEYWPVFRYTHNGRENAYISRVGRRGGPSLALRLFEPCHVFIDPESPKDVYASTIIPKLSESPSFIRWLSDFLEGVFSQWGPFSVFVLLSVFFTFTGIMQATFLIKSKPRSD